MTVNLEHHTPLYLAAKACHMSQDNHEKSDTLLSKDAPTLREAAERCEYDYIGSKDAALIERVGNKFKHASILEQLVYTFDIDGISRALLQELSRHRHQSLTVKSTRYTLAKDLKNEESFMN